MTEILSNLKFKQFELDRLQVLHEETTQNLKQANIDIALYQEKLQVRIAYVYVCTRKYYNVWNFISVIENLLTCIIVINSQKDVI